MFTTRLIGISSEYNSRTVPSCSDKMMTWRANLFINNEKSRPARPR